MRVLAELKEQGAFGTIMHVEGNYSHDWLANYPADSWRMQAEESRAGGMTGMGIHVLDCFRDMVGPTIWLGPIYKNKPVQGGPGQETAGYHGYWITDFTRVDDHFGDRGTCARSSTPRMRAA